MEASPTEDTYGSVADYKSVALPLQKDFEEIMDKLEASYCFSSPLEDDVALCNAMMVAAGFQGEIVGTSLRGAQKEGVPAYIGDLPPELDGIMQNTLRSADAVVEAAENWEEADCPDGPDCRLGMITGRVMDNLLDDLTNWNNY